MRLDKWLKVSRLIKRRTVANEACDNQRVTANGRPVKASYDVKVGCAGAALRRTHREGGGAVGGRARGQGRRPRPVQGAAQLTPFSSRPASSRA